MTPAVLPAPDELTFDESSHTYRFRGTAVPGVTGVIQSLHSFAGIPRAILIEAAARGTAVHLATQFFDEGDLDESSLSEAVGTRVEGWKRFVADMRPEWLAIEVRLLHRVHLYAGTADRFAILKGEPWVIDIKTAQSSHPVWGLQTAAYAQAANLPECRRGTVQLLPDGTYRLREWSDPSDFPTFLSALNLNRWTANHEA